ncbi:MAG: cadherin-like beta sandwich domain-containing protein [Ruminococcaceae bacterium]|nr:cadherin-like beta sandwich domain-containing protein [Oscillospiraceae bacterium]
MILTNTHFGILLSSSKGSGGGRGGSSGGSSGGLSGGSSGGSSSGGSTGSSSTPSKPSSGAASNENKPYEIENISLEDGFEFEEDFDKEVLDYEVIIDFDVDTLKLNTKFTAGATVTIDGKEALSETPFEILNIESGESEVEIVIMDGIRTLKTYKIKINKGYPAPEGTIEALNELFKTTQNAEEDAQAILDAFGNAKIEGAIILLTAQYKAEYDIMAKDSDLTQRQFMSLLSKVNEEDSDILKTALGIKDEDGVVYTKTIAMTENGMFNVGVRYAATSAGSNKKLAVYIDGVKYESEEINLDSKNGWVDTNIKVPLIIGDNELSMYAETEEDGNFGIIVKDIAKTGEKLATSIFKLEAENAEYSTTNATPYQSSTLDAGYKQTKSSVSGSPVVVGGGNIVFRFNSPAAQNATLKITYYMGASGSDWRLGFFNPVATPSSYNLDMVEGVDYPALSEAVFNAATWCSNTTKYTFEVNVDVVKGENVVWIPGRNLLCVNAEQNGTANMYINNSKRPNHQTQVDFIEVVPADLDLTAIKK